jgi:hypothetical protein
MMYVLIVISSVYNGQSITTQEFSSQQRCEAALEFVQKNSRVFSLQKSMCVPK